MLSISFPWDRCSSYYNAQQLSVFLVTTKTYFHLSIIIQEIFSGQFIGKHEAHNKKLVQINV